KAFVDKSTRFFWAASYGQIYPELRKLADAGLIQGEAKPAGGRRRTVYELTPEGRKRLREWLEVEPEALEMRDEGLLKLFFADAAGGRSAAATLAAKRRHHLEAAEQLRASQPRAAASPERSRARVDRLERQLRARRDVASVHGYYDTRSPAFVSRDGHETYLSVALKPTDDKKLQDAGNAITDNLDGKPGVEVGGFAVAEKQVN